MNLSPSGEFVRFSVEAARELGVFEGVRMETRRFRRLMEVLEAAGVMDDVPEPVEVVREGWGRLAEIIDVNLPHPRGPETRDLDDFFHLMSRVRGALRGLGGADDKRVEAY